MSDPGPWRYSACGLVIESDAPLGGWQPVARTVHADITISMRDSTMPEDPDVEYPDIWYVSPEVNESGSPEMRIESGRAGYRLTYGDEAIFVVSRTGGHVRAVARTNPEIATYLSGSVLAFLLRLRGLVPLHASAVVVRGRAMLFVGDSWSGKSSIAAALWMMGYPLLSDDIVRVDAPDADLLAYPCHPRVNVWGDSAVAVFGTSSAAPVHSDAYRKCSVDLIEADYRFQEDPAPIGAVYLMASRISGRRVPAIRRMPPRDALIALVRHSFGGCLLDGEMRGREFEVFSRLVERVPVRELAFGDSLDDLVVGCHALIAKYE